MVKTLSAAVLSVVLAATIKAMIDLLVWRKRRALRGESVERQ